MPATPRPFRGGKAGAQRLGRPRLDHHARILQPPGQRRRQRFRLRMDHLKPGQPHPGVGQGARRGAALPRDQRRKGPVERQPPIFRHRHLPAVIAPRQCQRHADPRRAGRGFGREVIAGGDPVGQARRAGEVIKIEPARPRRARRGRVGGDHLKVDVAQPQ